MPDALYVGDQSSHLWVIRPNINAVTNDIGDVLDGATQLRITGMAWDATTSTLYAVTGNADPNFPHYLITIDPTDGTATLIGDLGAGKTATDIAINSTGDIYGWQAGGNGVLLSINKATGAASRIGAEQAGFGGGGCVFVADVFYWIPQLAGTGASNKVSTVDLGTGALTPIADLGGDVFSINCAVVHEGTVYGGNNNSFYELDLNTGIGTFVMSWPDPISFAVDGLGSVPIPPAPTPPTPPPNDDFANAEVITGISGTVAGTLAGATPDWPPFAGPSIDPTVWYSWTAPNNGTVTFSSPQTGNVYLCGGGPTLADLVLLAVLPATTVVTEGTTYYIIVADTPAAFELDWSEVGTQIVYADLPWREIITTRTSRTLAVLDRRSTGRQFLFTLNQPAYHTAQVASDDVIIDLPFPDPDSPAILSNNVRLLYAFRREPGASPPYVCRFGGIIMDVEDQGDDAPTTRYVAYDPWQYMMNRPIRDPDTSLLPGIDGLKFPPNSRASDIAVALLQTTEIVEGETHIDLDGTTMPLVEDTAPLPYGIKFDQGTSVGEAWLQLCDTGTIDIVLPPLYDPDNKPGKVCQFQTTPKAGSTRYSAAMGWDRAGNSVAAIDRSIDGKRLLNRAQYFAGQGGVPVPLESDAASISLYGEYWSQQFFPGSHDRNLVDLLALAEVQIRKNGARQISFDPTPERTLLALRDYGLGDYVPVWASRNLREPIGIDFDTFDPDFPGASGYQRCYVIPIDVDDDGTTRVRGILTAQESTSG